MNFNHSYRNIAGLQTTSITVVAINNQHAMLRCSPNEKNWIIATSKTEVRSIIGLQLIALTRAGKAVGVVSGEIVSGV